MGRITEEVREKRGFARDARCKEDKVRINPAICMMKAGRGVLMRKMLNFRVRPGGQCARFNFKTERL
jgi:hypothetical protein